MKIIAHRGASGLALENTMAAFELARLLGVDAIELDVRRADDATLVVCHDATLARVSGSSLRVSGSTHAELRSIRLNDKVSTVPSLEQVMKATGNIHLIIELKSAGCVPGLIKLLDKHPKRRVSIASFRHGELSKLKAARPKTSVLALEQTKPFEIVTTAKRERFQGIGLNFWLLNPLTYWWIRRAGLTLYVYTINSRLLGGFISWLYPEAAICTDHPEWFIKHPWLKVKRSFADKHRKES